MITKEKLNVEMMLDYLVANPISPTLTAKINQYKTYFEREGDMWAEMTRQVYLAYWAVLSKVGNNGEPNC